MKYNYKLNLILQGCVHVHLPGLKEKIVIVVICRLVVDEDVFSLKGGELRSSVNKHVVIQVPVYTFQKGQSKVQLQVFTHFL